ncbi:MAG: ATP-binding protein, partial [Actinomycetota bacterium]
LRDAHGLLVLDNCEQVISPVARIVQRIVQHCPGVTVLATSRERLGIAGEQVLFLPPLPAPEPSLDRPLRQSPAVALFTDRLRAAGAADLPDDQLPLVADICRRVGGLPLAIELAAARSRSLGVATVAGRSPLELLTGGERHGQPGHQSLRAVLDWSHNLLDADEQILFRRLAVFRGRFTLGEVEDVCPDGVLSRGRVADALAGLVDKSIVAGPDGERYRLLDPIREYSNVQLVSHGEDVLLGAAHAQHFVRFAENARDALYSPREPEAASSLADRIDELRVAHRWSCEHDAGLALRLAVALAQYASYYMRFELQDWAAAAATLPDAAEHPLRAVALGSAASGAWARGEFDEARRLAQHGLEAAAGDGPLAARPMLVLADIAGLEGRFTDAVTSYEEAVRLAADVEPHICCEGLGGAAIALCHQGDMGEAVRLTDEGRRIAEIVGAPGLVAMSLYFAGEIRMARDPAAALELLEEARRVAEDTGALFVVGIATLSAVSVRARAGGDTDEAVAAFREAVEHWRRVGNRAQQWVTMRNLLPVLVAAGHDELACVLHGALGSAPVRLPADVAVPEAAALAVAVAEATRRLGDGAAEAAIQRGRRISLDELVSAVLAELQAPSGHATSSR